MSHCRFCIKVISSGICLSFWMTSHSKNMTFKKSRWTSLTVAQFLTRSTVRAMGLSSTGPPTDRPSWSWLKGWLDTEVICGMSEVHTEGSQWVYGDSSSKSHPSHNWRLSGWEWNPLISQPAFLWLRQTTYIPGAPPATPPPWKQWSFSKEVGIAGIEAELHGEISVPVDLLVRFQVPALVIILPVSLPLGKPLLAFQQCWTWHHVCGSPEGEGTLGSLGLIAKKVQCCSGGLSPVSSVHFHITTSLWSRLWCIGAHQSQAVCPAPVPVQ